MSVVEGAETGVRAEEIGDITDRRDHPLIAQIRRTSSPSVPIRIGVRAIIWTLICAFVLTLLFGMRFEPPPYDKRFLDYLGRVGGFIPQACAAVSGRTPLETRELSIGNKAKDIIHCEWRHGLPRIEGIERSDRKPEFLERGWNFLKGALSPSSIAEGLVQKVTLLAFLVGLFMIRRLRLERNYQSAIVANTEKVIFAGNQPSTVFPTTRLVLPTPKDDPDFIAYQSQVDNIYKIATADAKRTGNDAGQLFVACVQTAAAAGRVSELPNRIRELVADFREKIEARYVMLDYVVWLLPTLGFLGTIYGISTALVMAKGIFDEDCKGPALARCIDPVVSGLGIAFDTTAFALTLVAVLYLMQKLTESSHVRVASLAHEQLTKQFVPKFEDAVANPSSHADGEVAS